MEQILQDSYRYTLNGVYHEICNPNSSSMRKLDISSLRSREKHLVSQKFLLKYLHDLFEHHQIDYTIFHETLRGQSIFQGIHIFEKKIEICMMYRPLQTLLGQDLLRDGFFLDFESPYFAVISTQFFDLITVKAYIYFFRRDLENTSQIITIHPLYLSRFKRYTDLDLSLTPLHSDRDYKILSLPLSTIFPPQRAPFEDFEVYLPHKPSLLLALPKSPMQIEEEKEKEKETDATPDSSILQHLFSFLRPS